MELHPSAEEETRWKRDSAPSPRMGIAASCTSPDLWTKRVPTRFRKEGPKVVRGPDGTRRVPEVGARNFLWGSDFPGLDSPWPHSRAQGHAPAEAALGKAALDQLVLENAVSLYRIPVTRP